MRYNAYAATPREDIAAALACVRPGDKFVDLGAGDGHIVLAARELGADAIGWELDAELIRKTAHIPGIKRRDYMAQDWSPFDVIYVNVDTASEECALIQRKFDAECRPGARLVIYTLPVLVHG